MKKSLQGVKKISKLKRMLESLQKENLKISAYSGPNIKRQW